MDFKHKNLRFAGFKRYTILVIHYQTLETISE
uniref:Uncharacterized protein n=1 Tax=Salix viminalis TaxID=40686 RepID=A0A6N2JW18_SALVM